MKRAGEGRRGDAERGERRTGRLRMQRRQDVCALSQGVVSDEARRDVGEVQLRRRRSS